MDQAEPLALPGSCTTTPEQSLTRSLTRPQRRTATVAVVLLAVAGLWALHSYLAAIGWGVIFAVSLWPWYTRVAVRWPRGRAWALPGLVTFLVLLAFVLPLILVIAAIIHDSVGVMQWAAEAGAQGVPPPDFLGHLPFGSDLTHIWRDQLGRPGGLVLRRPGVHGLPHGAGRFALGAVHRLLLVAFMLLTLFFLLRDGERVAMALRVGSRRGLGPAGEHVGEQMIQAIRGTVNGLVMIGLGEGGLLGASYAATGVPHPALLGLVTALFSAIPLGAVVVYAAAAVLLVAQGNVAAGIAVAVFGSVVVFVADHFVRPALIGGRRGCRSSGCCWAFWAG